MTPTSPPRAVVLVTVFVTGASVLAVEIVGARILSAVFGVGLYAWSSLLGVTMGALATGYFAGGALGDRRPRLATLAGTVAVAGVAVALAALARRPVLTATDPLGVRLGTLVSAAVLFGPGLAALGAAGPIAVRLVAGTGAEAAGRAAGRVYGVSTAGSLLGALGTGFVLVPAAPTSTILGLVAAALLATAAAGLGGAARAGAAGAMLLPLVAALLPPGPLPEGVAVVAGAQSLHGRLEVIVDSERHIRALRADGSLLGGVHLDPAVPGRERPLYPYTSLLADAARLHPAPRRVLQIGLGIGSAPRYLTHRGLVVDVVELDPEVVRLARERFGFETRGEVHVGDARTFLAHGAAPGAYDVILHDVFTSGAVPSHLLTVESLRRTRAALTSDGVLALAWVGAHRGPAAAASETVARTLRAVFPEVRCVRDRDPGQDPEGIANLVFYASDRPLDLEGALPRLASREVLTTQTGPDPADAQGGGAIATDARNPLDRLQMPITAAYHRAIRALYPTELWVR